jgi:hypothetical protein
MSDTGREPICIIAIGFKGIGKTYTTKEEVNSYIKNDPSTGRKARPVLVFDVNGEYDDYKAIDFDIEEPDERIRGAEIRKIKMPGKYRVVSYKKNHDLMSPAEMYATVITISKYFRGGLLILEDINRYMVYNVKIDMVGLLIGLRHYGVDLTIHFQSMRAIPRRFWGNTDILRLHKQAESIDSYRDKVNNYELFKIAEIIVDARHQQDKYYKLWIDILNNKLINIDERTFSFACRQYLAMNNRVIRSRLNYIEEDGTKKYSDSLNATSSFIEEKWQQYTCSE